MNYRPRCRYCGGEWSLEPKCCGCPTREGMVGPREALGGPSHPTPPQFPRPAVTYNPNTQTWEPTVDDGDPVVVVPGDSIIDYVEPLFVGS